MKTVQKMKTFGRKQFNKDQQGLTLIELGVGLVVAAAVIAGALALFNSTSTAQKVTQLGSDLQSMRAGIKQLDTQYNSYIRTTVDNGRALVNGELVPTTIRVDTSPTPIPAGTAAAYRNAFGGTVLFGTPDASIDSFFTMTINNLPQGACERLAPEAGSTGTWDMIYVGPTGTPPAVATTIAALQNDVEAGVINGVCSGNANTITFVSR